MAAAHDSFRLWHTRSGAIYYNFILILITSASIHDSNASRERATECSIHDSDELTSDLHPSQLGRGGGIEEQGLQQERARRRPH
jgi:hypothetical protein